MGGWRGGHKRLIPKPCGAGSGHARRAPHLRRQAQPSAPAPAQSGRSSGVEHNLAKVGVEGSNPFARSSCSQRALVTHPVLKALRLACRWCRAGSSLCGARRRTDMADQAELTRADTRATFQTVNPATGEPGKSYPQHTLADARQAAAAAHGAFLDWRRTSFGERARVVRKAGEILRARQDELARLMTAEMGKTLGDGRAEIGKCAVNCEWFADHAAEYLADQPTDIGGPEAFVTFNPLGVVLAVMPWNFPFWQVFRFAAPALMAGNGALLKHASNVPGSALAIEEVLHQAGVPKKLFRTLLLPSAEVEALIKDDNVAAVTLTGSVAAGKSVATAAGSVLKKCVLELGGSDAYVVLEDADIAAAARVAATARMVNGGQSCIAGKRFIVVRSIVERFEQALVEIMRGYEMGDPAKEGTKLGPMQSVKARDDIHKQVEESIARGAKLLLGGVVPVRP